MSRLKALQKISQEAVDRGKHLYDHLDTVKRPGEATPDQLLQMRDELGQAQEAVRRAHAYKAREGQEIPLPQLTDDVERARAEVFQKYGDEAGTSEELIRQAKQKLALGEPTLTVDMQKSTMDALGDLAKAGGAALALADKPRQYLFDKVGQWAGVKGTGEEGAVQGSDLMRPVARQLDISGRAGGPSQEDLFANILGAGAEFGGDPMSLAAAPLSGATKAMKAAKAAQKIPGLAQKGQKARLSLSVPGQQVLDFGDNPAAAMKAKQILEERGRIPKGLNLSEVQAPPKSIDMAPEPTARQKAMKSMQQQEIDDDVFLEQMVREAMEKKERGEL